MDSDAEVAAAAGVAAARSGVAAFSVPRDGLHVVGGDAASFLQGQVSADVAALVPGAGTWALLLQPQGRIDAWVRVTRLDGDGFFVDVDAGWGEAVLTRLRRFLLRVDVSIEPVHRRCLSLRGPDSAAAAASVADGVLAVPVDWRGLAGVDLFGPPDGDGPDAAGGVVRADPTGFEVLRVEQGWPAMGRELDTSTIPAEAGGWLVDASVSFTKGCYTGQELVARIDSRGGNVPRRLRGLVLEGSEVPDVGAAVSTAGVERASVTSAVASPTVGAPIALTVLHRSVDVGATVDVDGVSATVVELPFVTA